MNKSLADNLEFQVLLPYFEKIAYSLGGDIVFVREGMPSKLLSWELEPVHGFYLELYLLK